MAYRLKLRKSLALGVRRVLAEQGERAVAALDAGADPVAAVHDARRALKRMRALLRLVRQGLGEESWRAENVALRDIGRRLSQLRDADVGRMTIEALAVEAPASLRAALSKLSARLDGAPGVSIEEKQLAVAGAARELAVICGRYPKLVLTGRSSRILAAGLEASHRRGRRAVAAVVEQGSDEAMHDLRKAVQAHWRHSSLLSAAWPDVMKARVAEARQLSGLLGAYNDLTLVVQHVHAAMDRGLGRREAQRIELACRERQAAIRREGIPRAQRLFAGKPRAVAAMILEAWAAAAVLDACAKPEPAAEVKEKSAA
jgi:CHAD domain-containing protein